MGKAIKYICNRGNEMSGNQKFVIGMVAAVCLMLALAATWPGGGIGAVQAKTVAPAVRSREGTLRVSGTAVVRAAPELATIHLGFESRALRARQARLENDAVMKKVLTALRENGIEQKDMQTVEYRLFPMWENWPRPTTRVWVWHVLHMVEVRIRKVDTASEVIDAASAAGADKMEDVIFSVESLHKLRAQARELACKVAREKAEQLADLMGVKLGAATYIADTSPRYSNYSRWSGSQSNVMAQAVAQAPSDGAEPDSLLNGGQISVESTEEVTFAIE